MSIKITPDKYPQIIEVYNTEGKTAAYDLMRSCYEIKNPTCVMKRMKADKSLGYNYDTDRFESDSRKEDDIFLNLLGCLSGICISLFLDNIDKNKGEQYTKYSKYREWQKGVVDL